MRIQGRDCCFGDLRLRRADRWLLMAEGWKMPCLSEGWRIVMCASAKNRPAPHVARYQCLRKVRHGGPPKKDFKNIYVRSRNVYENKQNHDKMPEKSRTFLSKFRTFLSNRHEFCRKKGLGDANLLTLRIETGNWKLETRKSQISKDRAAHTSPDRLSAVRGEKMNQIDGFETRN